MDEQPIVNVDFNRPQLISPRGELAVYTEKVLDISLKALGLPLAEVTVLYCSAATIRRLNKQFLGNDCETDVLSFPAADSPGEFPRDERFYLGDIALCLPVCAKQAAELGRRTADEVAMLAIHGLLHLAGYDHDTSANKGKMWRKTDQLLAKCLEIEKPKLFVRGAAG